ncbi:hypothetical protein RRG08_020729 [Elysia crispata]|uniref:Uncharacterized protein n=1 Tax=Elysia crispata TaxID=231223 RepID=A0AAE0Z702_9GAST|nr:hypothetical protein RRG08_020729 [Elysia crispata]
MSMKIALNISSYPLSRIRLSDERGTPQAWSVILISGEDGHPGIPDMNFRGAHPLLSPVDVKDALMLTHGQRARTL